MKILQNTRICRQTKWMGIGTAWTGGNLDCLVLIGSLRKVLKLFITLWIWVSSMAREWLVLALTSDLEDFLLSQKCSVYWPGNKFQCKAVKKMASGWQMVKLKLNNYSRCPMLLQFRYMLAIYLSFVCWPYITLLV